MDNIPVVYSRKDISTWLKSQPYSQNLNDGVLFCRVMQKTYPAYFLRLNDSPKSEFENLANFKMLNRCLDKNNLYKIPDLDKFAASKDFFQFTSWLKNFVDKNQSAISGSAIQLMQQYRKDEGQQATTRSPIVDRIKTAASMNSPAKRDDYELGLAASSKEVRTFINDSTDNYLRREDSNNKHSDTGNFLKEVGPPILSGLQAPTYFPPREPKPVAVTPPSVSNIDFYDVYHNDTKALLQLYAHQTDIEYLKEILSQLRHSIETSKSVEDLKNEIASKLFDKALK